MSCAKRSRAQVKGEEERIQGPRMREGVPLNPSDGSKAWSHKTSMAIPFRAKQRVSFRANQRVSDRRMKAPSISRKRVIQVEQTIVTSD